MQRSKNVQTKDNGFTLTEMIITVIVAGVLAAITLPSLVGLLNRNQVNEAQRQVETALKDAQRQAIRRGRSCRVTINTTANTISSPDNGCLLSQRDVDEGTLVGGDKVSLKANSNTLTISFTHKGTTTSQDVIVIDSSLTDAKKCVAIADGIGTVRTGTYTGNVNSTLNRSFCRPAD